VESRERSCNDPSPLTVTFQILDREGELEVTAASSPFLDSFMSCCSLIKLSNCYSAHGLSKLIS
jgi:hypothetical protein